MINAFPKHYANNGHVLAQEPLPSLYILNQEAGTISNVKIKLLIQLTVNKYIYKLLQP